MTDHGDIWVSAAEALYLVSLQLARSIGIDASQARDEAKGAIIGMLASGRMRSCPHGYLTSTLLAEGERIVGYHFAQLSRDGEHSRVEIDFDCGSGHPLVPVEFWRMFRDPSAGANANWQDGDFSFDITARSGTSFFGMVSNLCVDPEGLRIVETPAPAASGAATGNHVTKPLTTAESDADSTASRRGRGRPTMARDVYLELHKQRFESGEAFSMKSEEADFLLRHISKQCPNKKIPNIRTIRNWLVKYGYDK